LPFTTAAEAAGSGAASGTASYSAGFLAPDAIGTIFGNGYMTQAAATESSSGSESVPAETNLAQPTVRIIDNAGMEYQATVFFASPNQINFQMPSDITMGAALVTVRDFAGGVSPGSFTVAPVAPGMFSANSTGQPARIDGDVVFMAVAAMIFAPALLTLSHRNVKPVGSPPEEFALGYPESIVSRGAVPLCYSDSLVPRLDRADCREHNKAHSVEPSRR